MEECVEETGSNNLKGPVQYFSMQVVMNKCFLLNPEKKKKKRYSDTLQF